MKLVLIPLAVVAVIVFLLLLGAFGLAVALLVIAVFRQLGRLLVGGGRFVGRGGRRLRRGRGRQGL